MHTQRPPGTVKGFTTLLYQYRRFSAFQQTLCKRYMVGSVRQVLLWFLGQHLPALTPTSSLTHHQTCWHQHKYCTCMDNANHNPLAPFCTTLLIRPSTQHSLQLNEHQPKHCTCTYNAIMQSCYPAAAQSCQPTTTRSVCCTATLQVTPLPSCPVVQALPQSVFTDTGHNKPPVEPPTPSLTMVRHHSQHNRHHW